ncbi:hypothetical protein [Indioceanicola profundi]|uniref:hypothetical protein n=1 Tax=Indioceanicola profundi TaxID=2220096 RepID=UPI000E6AD1F0|nr:hypothetical protein [Indioceanicola profundi]
MIPVSFDITLFIVAVLGAVVAVGMALARQVLTHAQRTRIAAAQARNAQLRRQQDQLTDQFRRLQDRARDAEVEVKSMHTQIMEAQRRIRAAKADSYLVVHELGDPGGHRRLFTSALGLGPMLTVNRVAVTDGPLRGARHHLEVWAETAPQAAELARRAFPSESGFQLSGLDPASGQQAAPAPARPQGRSKPLSRAAAE